MKVYRETEGFAAVLSTFATAADVYGQYLVNATRGGK